MYVSTREVSMGAFYCQRNFFLGLYSEVVNLNFKKTILIEKKETKYGGPGVDGCENYYNSFFFFITEHYR